MNWEEDDYQPSGGWSWSLTVVAIVALVFVGYLVHKSIPAPSDTPMPRQVITR